MHFIFFEQCAHFNVLYFCNERAERLWSHATRTHRKTNERMLHEMNVETTVAKHNET